MRARVLTALALIPPVLAAIFVTTPWPMVGLGVVALWIGFAEASRLLDGRVSHGPVLGTAVLAAAAAISAGEMAKSPLAPHLLLALNVLGIIMTSRMAAGAKGRLGLELASLWVAAPLAALLLLHGIGPEKATDWSFASPVLMSLLPLWAGDTAAIFIGRWLGKHPLAPSISPKKTVEGGVANLLACLLVALVLGTALRIPWPAAAACGVAAGVFGQAGDLFESSLKRRAGVKDSGALLPGHGGLLDRIDSVLFTATPVLAILWFFPPTG